MSYIEEPQLFDLFTMPSNHVDLRKNALSTFQEMGLPTTRLEEYRFTPISKKLRSVDWRTSSQSSIKSIEPFQIPNLNSPTIVMVNGVFSSTLSTLHTQQGITIQPLQMAPTNSLFDTLLSEKKDAFASFNSAFWTDGFYISIQEHVVLEKPLTILHITDTHQTPVAFQTRFLIHLGKNSSASIIEKYISNSGESFQNSGLEIFLEPHASLEFCLLQQAKQTIHTNNTVIHQSDGSILHTFSLTTEGDLIRNNLEIQIDGEHCESNFHGLYIANNNSLFDNHTVVDHRKPNSHSNELYKGVMMDQAIGVFNGKIFVRPHAQKTVAFQSNRNILLSDTSTIHTKPQLEIWADDVKCSHGCTTGQLDEEALFYLKSRGISKDKAQSLLLHAFASEVVSSIKNTDVRNYLDEIIATKLHLEML